MKFLSNLALLFLLSPLMANAGGIDSLKAFFQNTQSLKAQFHQEVSDNQGRKVQEVDGMVQIQRQADGPGKFRWDYNKPYVQEIVGDGEKVWLFDPELNQVTVRTIGKALGSSPAALLAGSKELPPLAPPALYRPQSGAAFRAPGVASALHEPPG